jgi:tetratricopeptide (TPR) repeat protein
MRKKMFSALLVLNAIALFAQMEPLERGNKAFEYKDYSNAIDSYEEVLKTEPNNIEALRKVAHAYKASYLLSESAEMLSQLVALPAHTAADDLAFGQVLMQQGKYEKAKVQFDNYAAAQPELGRYFAKAAENALKLSKDEPLFVVKNLGLNSDAADFCAATYSPQQIVFASTRDPQTQKSKAAVPARLFVATQNSKDDFTNVKLEKRALNDKESEGPVAYNSGATAGVFARNNIKNGVTPLPNTGMKQDLFFGTVKSLGLWLEVKPFIGNQTDCSMAYPFITENGKTLYFASDMAGGQGGFDIYKSENIGGKWTAPINLGDKVNTAGDEITPFVEDNTLAFSSNWLMGLGGFDVFELEMQDENAVPVHLGTGVNSAGDDFGYTYNSRLNYGFLTSNREGGKGQEDIYHITKKQAKVVAIAPSNTEKSSEVAAVDAPKEVVAEYKSSTVVPNSNRATKHIGNELKEKIQQNQQVAAENTPAAVEVIAAVAKTEAAPTISDVAAAEVALIESTPATIAPAMEPVAPQTEAAVEGLSQGFVIDANTKQPLEGVAIKCTNKTDKKESQQQVLTDAKGAYFLQINPNTQYWIEYAVPDYKGDFQQFTTNDAQYDLGYMSLKPRVSGLTPIAFGLPSPAPEAKQKGALASPSLRNNPAAATDQTVYEIHVTATEEPLSAAKEEDLRKHGTLYKVKKEAFYLYKLGWYDNINCATTTCEKIQSLGYKSAMATPKKVNPNTSETQMRLKIGGQKASCPAERPGTGGKIPAPKPPKDTLKDAPKEVGKETVKEYKAPTNPVAASQTPEEAIEEGAILDADPEAAKRAEDDGFLYYIQLGSFDPSRKIVFSKIEKLKLGKISKQKAADGRAMYMLGTFNSRDTAYKARKMISETGEVNGAFILKYDKEGNKVQ